MLSSLTAFSYIQLGTESVEKNRNLTTLLKQQSGLATSQLRQPASQRNLSRSSSEILSINKELFCAQKNLQQESSQSQSKINRNMVMLSFRLCKNLHHIEQVKIENVSNGFKAQSFKLATQDFKTDYIQLSPGLNKLKLEIILKDGQKMAEALDILSGS